MKPSIKLSITGKRGTGGGDGNMSEKPKLEWRNIDFELPPDCRVVLVQAVNTGQRKVWFTAYLHHMSMIWYSPFPSSDCITNRLDTPFWRVQAWAFSD